jgi:pimeloyl-ACP methyl ester carboxylesterase
MNSKRDAVVLVHGLGAHPLIFRPLEGSLRGDFGQLVNWGYSSLWSPLERHGHALAELLRQMADKDAEQRIHLVTHSMGSIIGRLALAEFRPGSFGRFVMIAPPNRGSRVARRLAPYFGRFCPPLCQLTDDESSYVCQLPGCASEEFGVIAATIDHLVHEPSTHLPGERDHIVLPGLHSSLLWKRETAEQVRHFLWNGRFRRGAAAQR